jgi:hypothetical protein
MKKFTKTILAATTAVVVSCAVFGHQARAVPITGEVDMSGTAFLNNTNLGSATAATGFSGVTVGGIPTGSFAGTAGDSVTWNAFGWNPFVAPVPNLWSFTDAGTGGTYTFDLSSAHVVTQTNFFLNLTGHGTLTITGTATSYNPTSGVWSFTISNPTGGPHANFAFTFANSQTAVPDGGSAVALLGVALAGIEILRRKLRTA